MDYALEKSLSFRSSLPDHVKVFRSQPDVIGDTFSSVSRSHSAAEDL